MQTSAIQLPANGRSIGTAACPYCGKAIGLDFRCPHLDDLLPPGVNDGHWAVVVTSEACDIPVMKMRCSPEPGSRRTPRRDPNYGRFTDSVLLCLAAGRATSNDIQARVGGRARTASMALHRLWASGYVEVIGEIVGKMGRRARVYGLTKAGRERAKQAASARHLSQNKLSAS